MEARKTSIPGCVEIPLRLFQDDRGSFVKTYHADKFRLLGIEETFAEIFYSTSHRGVIRGLHFQLPPADHSKLVSCLSGEVFDAVADLRLGSPAYGKFEVFYLRACEPSALYIPAGCAHGFCALSNDAIMLYKTSTVHSPAHDAGIRWDSLKIPWPVQSPIVSVRDLGFPEFSSFCSPFKFG